MERLCEDLVADILSCLPAKSAVRFRCLSKYYDQLVSDSRFATNHALRSNPDQVHGLLRFTGRSPDKILFYSFYSKQNINNNPKVVANNYQIIASCNGLILGLSDSRFSVCNPIVPDRIQTIPKLETPYGKCDLGLAYDPIGFSSLEFKLVHVYREQTLNMPEDEDAYGFMIFDSSANSWRQSTCKLFLRNLIQMQPHFYELKGQAVYLNGSLHWFRALGDIVAFNVEKEEATLIGMPPELRLAWLDYQNYSWFGAADGFLYVVYVFKRQILMWVLLDYENSKWGLVRNKIKGLSRVAHPIFFDGERIVLKCGSKKKLLRLFNLKQEQWKEMGRLPRNTMDDSTTVYIPFNPTLAPLINNSNPSSTDSLPILPTMMPINNKCKKRKRGRINRK